LEFVTLSQQPGFRESMALAPKVAE